MRLIDEFLNSITMYRLTLYVLIAYLIAAFILSIVGVLAFNPLSILVSTLIAVVVGYIANIVFARIFHAVTNVESVFITALILACLISPNIPQNSLYIAVASVVAMAVKYLPVIDKRHIFNPAAGAVAAIVLLSPTHAATWWIGTAALTPFVLIGGVLIMRKIRREAMVGVFFAVFFSLITLASLINTGTVAGVLHIWQISVLQTSLLFFTFIMLTEPITSPTTKRMQMWYTILVAVLFATPQLRLGIFLAPEVALLIGNIFAYVVSPWSRFHLSLERIKQVSDDTYAFFFPRPSRFSFVPGQYMEWTLPHEAVDNRGNRRYFSLSSSPTEKNLQILVKFHNPSSTYKESLLGMTKNDSLIATQIAGDFVLPKKRSTPMVWIAGGVGFAPFRSMLKYIIDKKIMVDIIVLFSNRYEKDIMYQDLLSEAEKYGVTTHYILTGKKTIPTNWIGEVGYFTPAMIRKLIPDFTHRSFYISGPQIMVQGTQDMLENMHIKRSRIVTDYFPGY